MKKTNEEAARDFLEACASRDPKIPEDHLPFLQKLPREDYERVGRILAQFADSQAP